VHAVVGAEEDLVANHGEGAGGEIARRNIFGSIRNASGGSESVPDAPKVVPEASKDLPMLRKAFRELQK